MSTFFAPSGIYPPCGMFTPTHLIATGICILLVAVALFYSLKHYKQNMLNIPLKVLAVLLVVLESTKIAHSFINGNTNLDSWLPLSYCSLFIYAVWMVAFGKSYFKKAGEAFITYGCPVAGLAFLIFPTTSLMNYPIWHFLSLYSMFFHSLMLFFGIIHLVKSPKLNIKTYLCYISLIVISSIPAITLNVVKNCNLMNLREPYNIPIAFLQNLYSRSQWAYTALVLFAYLLIPALMGLLSGKIKIKSKFKCARY